jgi:hypothetical protein
MNCAMVWAPRSGGPPRAGPIATRESVLVYRGRRRLRAGWTYAIRIGSEPCASPIVVMRRVVPALRPENTRLTAANLA